MDPSKVKIHDKKSSPKKKTNPILAFLFLLLLTFSGGIGFFLYHSSGEKTTVPVPRKSSTSAMPTQKTGVSLTIQLTAAPGTSKDATPSHNESNNSLPQDIVSLSSDKMPSSAPTPLVKPLSEKKTPETALSCNQATRQLNNFYKHLDRQPYMARFHLKSPSKSHFTTLIKKLLANPPQVSRETDDLYTILKNTAHFFRISGKDNILMLKGILNNEKNRLEKILASYYYIVTTPECNTTFYGGGIETEALYEYACFFLNTMGGRLYLFRRDSQSRMVVTYYAILLVDCANTERNNRHGISLKPFIDMLIAEMETGGGALQHKDSYLDKLYDLKEKYQ